MSISANCTHFLSTEGRFYVAAIPAFLGFFSIAAAGLAFNGFRGTCSAILAIVLMTFDGVYSIVISIVGICILPSFFIECSGKVVYGIYFTYLLFV